MMRGAITAAGLAALFACSGCFVEAGTGSAPLDSGVLVIDWSINGTKDPDQCDQGNADVVDIMILSPSGRLLAEYEQDCAAFATSIELLPGDYAADVVLLDPGGNERTTPIRVRPFTIYGGDQLDIPVDFPASSFY